MSATATAETVERVDDSTAEATVRDAGGKSKSKKIALNLEGAVDSEGNSIVNDEGKLTGNPLTVPSPNEGEEPIFVGWNKAIHKPLKKGDFANEVTFLRWQIHLKAQTIEKAQAEHDKMVKRADALAQYGNSSAMKNALKLQKYREEMAKVEAELMAEGVDMAELEALIG